MGTLTIADYGTRPRLSPSEVVDRRQRRENSGRQRRGNSDC